MSSPSTTHARPEARPVWHALETGETLARLESGTDGLTDAEAARRLARRGPNALILAKPVSALRILTDQVKSVIVLLLAVAALVALTFGDVAEAAAIGVVLLLNVGIGFWMEWRARRSVEALRRTEVHEATVVRAASARRIDAAQLVPGDVLLLEAGEAVPADARLLVATELSVNEAPLTGESVPDRKSAEPVAADTPLADRTSMVWKGTLAVSGTGRAVVCGTGRETEIGRITELVAETADEETPLELRLARLGRRLVVLTLAIAAAVLAVGLLRGQETWLMVETAIALAVAAVPEGLPVVAVLTLAVGMHRMARRRALVRRLAAVEALGSTTLVCTDKTGTLTAGEMTAVVLALPHAEVAVTGAGYAPEGQLSVAGHTVDPRAVPGLVPALEIGALANRAGLLQEEDGWRVEGDPSEGALLVLAQKAGLDRARLLGDAPETGDVPFSSERMMMATFHARPGGGVRVCVKGAPHRILERCARIRGAAGAPGGEGAHGIGSLEAEERAHLEAQNAELAARGLRVLALAERELGPAERLGEEALRDLVFVAHVGLLDPPAAGVRETIGGLQGAGIRTVMITGDQRLTAEAVARELGVLVPGGEVLDASVLDALDDDELFRRLETVVALSRVSPEGKLRVVRGFRERGEVVAMLGDGLNDAAALKGADIGVAMGRRGTDVAKETADVVLADDRFESIAAAVEGGRVIDDNIRKFVFYLFSSNLSEVLVVFLAGLAGLPPPLRPLQILWINLITDVFPALALALEPAEPGVMSRRPRDPSRSILSRPFMLAIGGHAGTLTAVSLGTFVVALGRTNAAHAGTLTFLVLAAAQVLHVLNARSEEPVLFSRRLFTNRWVLLAIAVSLALLLAAALHGGLGRVLDVAPLSASDGFLIALLSAVPLSIGQLAKLARRRRARQVDSPCGPEGPPSSEPR